jgi:hypothetical protein
MSFAYEVTPDDVLTVLELHQAAETREDELVEDAYSAVVEMEARITEAVLEYADVGARRLVALQEIEAILIEDGLLEEPARIHLPA